MRWYQECRSLFEVHADPERAACMSHLMRDQFSFFGISNPERRRITRSMLTFATLQMDWPQIEAVVRQFWQAPERELQYFACDLLARCHKCWCDGTLALCQELICSKSWWDTVDCLASRVVGPLLERLPHGREVMDLWAGHENPWLRRVAILHQLQYRHKTDEQRLFHYCLSSSEHSEVFVRKAAGWALREYAKSAPDRVEDFLKSHQDQFSWVSLEELAVA